jgi:hypothetical protein
LPIDIFAMNGEDSADEWAGCSSRGDEGFDMRGSLVGIGVDDPKFLLLQQVVSSLHAKINV